MLLISSVRRRLLNLVVVTVLEVCVISMFILRAEDTVLRDLVETRNYTRGNPAQVEFTPDGRHVLFLRSGPRDDTRALFEFSMADGTTREILNSSMLLGDSGEILTPEERARRERMRLTAAGLASYSVSKNGQKILIPIASRLFVLNRTNGITREINGARGGFDPHLSPDGDRVAYVVGHDLFVSDLQSNRRWQVTHEGTDLVSYGTSEFVAQEELGRMHGFWWAPDGKSLLVERADAHGVET